MNEPDISRHGSPAPEEDWVALFDQHGGRFRMVMDSERNCSQAWWSDSLLRKFNTPTPLPLDRLFAMEDRGRLQAILTQLRDGDPFTFMGRADGRPIRQLKISGHVAAHGVRAVIFGIVQEIPLRWGMSTEQAARLGALGEMASGIAHEINNPLAIISAASQHLQTVAGKGRLKADVLQKHLGLIGKTVDRIAQTIVALRDFSRDGQHDPFVVMPLSEVLRATLPFCQERFVNHGIDLCVQFPPALWRVRCQSVRISQVLLNLLNNAYDAVMENHDRSMRIRIHIERDAHQYRIYVTDNGLGVSAHIAPSIMQPFFTTKPVGKGAGLGLSISAGIIKDHGGELSFRSLKEGAEFCIMLPASPASEDLAHE